jgi:hypothetical protein
LLELSLMTKRAALLGVWLSAAALAGEGVARANGPVVTTVVAPSHLTAGDQVFDASVAGMRAYIETIKPTNPVLYGQLAPRVARLESQRDFARVLLISGLVVGTASMTYAILGRSDCPEPAITDPNFASDSAAWGACNAANNQRTGTFLLVGVGALSAGLFSFVAAYPGRADLFDFVNENNRLSKEPLHLQMGYDPARRFAFGGATFRF